jgi:hypothetical protein
MLPHDGCTGEVLIRTWVAQARVHLIDKRKAGGRVGDHAHDEHQIELVDRPAVVEQHLVPREVFGRSPEPFVRAIPKVAGLKPRLVVQRLLLEGASSDRWQLRHLDKACVEEIAEHHRRQVRRHVPQGRR